MAPSGRPKPPPWPGSEEVSEVYGFQTLDDTKAIMEKADQSEHVLVMGGSFIAYELAEGVVHRGQSKVTWLMRGPWFLRYVLDAEGGQLCRQLGEAQGVGFICGGEAKTFSQSNGHHVVETENGERAEFDVLTYGVGLDYYTEPVAGTGIELNRGIVCDAKLQ